jgi:dTDP-4-dehydrorhamnose 3,5-epimerase
MRFEALEIPDVKLIFPKKFGDERGFFSETYNLASFSEAGIDHQFVQDNHSLSKSVGVLRGLHFQSPPFAQDKLVRVIRGRILDIAVDIRADSKTFGKSVSTEISAEDWNQIFIPAGFAHGFVTLDPDTEVNYKVSAPYAPESECAIMWNDPDLGIEWPFDENEITLSPKDAKAMSFATYRENPVF